MLSNFIVKLYNETYRLSKDQPPLLLSPSAGGERLASWGEEEEEEEEVDSEADSEEEAQ